ncbi:hypothetical protein J5N97_013067 [Dioscorea zingiberensis]|uniref:EF-hand domain-containing protein n=1 Tax=Dioscorea zingiberensis TaxID=325984 RepID=A0A9D5CQJ8_9LILI|nr:hypothetical protein J5N97_013067 [Dioscorea zingiberensis]
MALFNNSQGDANHARKMTKQEFMQWLKDVDLNGDGGISRKELRCALKAMNQKFAWFKAWRAMRHADLNKNGVIKGGNEEEALFAYARERLGIVVY